MINSATEYLHVALLNSPVEVGLPLVVGKAVQVTSVSGSVSTRFYRNISADGEPSRITDTASAAGISFVKGPIGALVGVFLDDAIPGGKPPPTAWDFSNLDSREIATLDPLLRQVFYIGRGKTTAGTLKSFMVPDGAKRLFLGVLTDAGDNSVNQSSFQVTAIISNSPPVLDPIPDPMIDELTLLNFVAKATDADIPGQTLTYSLDPGAPTGASIGAKTGVFTWTPMEAQGPGMYPITIHVTDNGTPILSTNQTFTVTINEVNSPPVLSPISAQTTDELKTLTVTPIATDTDIPANTLTFSLGADAPAGMSIIPNSGIINWTPKEDQGPGTYRVTVTVTDNGVPPLSASQSFNLKVNEVNSAPVLANIPTQTISENGRLDFTVSAPDSDVPVNRLTFSLEPGAPTGMTIDASTGHLTWSVGSVAATQTNHVTVRVTDDGSPALIDTKSFDVIVTSSRVHLAPIADRTTNELSRLIITPTVTNSATAIQPLIFSLDPGAPTNAVIDSNSGLLVWTPSEGQGPSTNTITIRVTDSGPALGNTASQTFTVVINEVNQAPVLESIGRQTTAVGQTLVVTVIAKDEDRPPNTLTYALEPGAPMGAFIDGKTGVFTWTPTEPYAETTNSVSVKVTDDGVPPLSGMATFDVVVIDPPKVTLSAAILPNGEIELTLVNADSRKTYFIEASPDLASWEFLSFVSAATKMRAVDQRGKSFRQRFYRAVSP